MPCTSPRVKFFSEAEMLLLLHQCPCSEFSQHFLWASFIMKGRRWRQISACNSRSVTQQLPNLQLSLTPSSAQVAVLLWPPDSRVSSFLLRQEQGTLIKHFPSDGPSQLPSPLQRKSVRTGGRGEDRTTMAGLVFFFETAALFLKKKKKSFRMQLCFSNHSASTMLEHELFSFFFLSPP